MTRPRPRTLTLLTAAAMLAACGDASEEGGAGAEGKPIGEAAMRAEAAALELTPGRWSTRIEAGSMKVPGVPPEMMAQMQAEGMVATEIVACLTADDIKGRGKLFDTGQGDCKVSRFALSGGKIDIAQSCSAPGGGRSADIAMTGSYTPDSYTIDMKVKGETDAGPIAGGEMTSRVIGKRLGACTGDEANAKR